jgi:hypothetical protein
MYGMAAGLGSVLGGGWRWITTGVGRARTGDPRSGEIGWSATGFEALAAVGRAAARQVALAITLAATRNTR